MTPPLPENTGKTFSKSELVEDLDFMLKTMEDIHPNLYFYLPEDSAKVCAKEVKKTLHDGYNRISFFSQAAQLVAQFHDGHTRVYIPNEEYFKYRDGIGLFFPFDVDCSSGKIKILQSQSEEYHSCQDAIITRINGHSAEKILDSMIAHLGFERREMSLKFLTDVFRKLLFLLYGPTSTFSLSLTNKGNVEELECSGVPFKIIKQNIEHEQTIQEVPYSFEILEEKKCAILDFRSFIDQNRFDKFAQNMFKDIKSAKVNKLVIDLRKNGGGNSGLTDVLASYLTDKPFRQFSGMDMKVSKLIRKHYSVMVKLHTSFPRCLIPARFVFPFPWKKKIGETISVEAEPSISESNPLRFKGRVIVLTGPYTFSSATGLAVAIKDNDIGIVVGSPTGGLASTYGDSFVFSLPNTHLQCGVSHKFFIRPNENRVLEPLHPDYLIDDSNHTSTSDRVLEFAINSELVNP